MKKFFIKLFLFASITFFFPACSNIVDTPKTYKIESGTVSNRIAWLAEDMISSYKRNLTFKRMEIVHDYLKEQTHSFDFIERKSDISREEIIEFLISKGFSQSAADKEVAFLDSNKNDLLFFPPEDTEESENPDGKTIWIYAEVE